MNPANTLRYWLSRLVRSNHVVRLLVLFFVAISFAVTTKIATAQEKETERPARTTEPPTRGTEFASRNAREAAKSRGDYTFDDIKLEMEKGEKFDKSKLSKEVIELDKKTIKIRGWILPTSVFQETGITQFVLVRDNLECCFGPGAALYDCIIVQMESGKSANFTTRPVAVKGKFELEEFKYPDGTHYAIYKMTGIEVK